MKASERNAVANFVASLHGLSYQEAKDNLEVDAKSYGWSLEAYSAAWQGILDHFAAEVK